MVESYQYVLTAAGWVPLELDAVANIHSSHESVFSLTYGRTAESIDGNHSALAVSAAPVGDTIPLDTNPNFDDPRGLVTVSAVYAMNAALTSVAPGRMVDETAATLAPVVNGSLRGASILYAHDGANFRRVASNTAGVLLSAPASEWSITHTPAANVQATITRAAVAAQRHTCRSITATLIGLAASVETTVLLNLRDGATIVWSTRLLCTGGAGSETGVTLSGLNIVGTANTAMTLEFAAAGGASTFESVAFTGNTAV